MKYRTLCLLLILSISAVGQKGSFDLVNYTQPNGWGKTPTEHAVQFTKEDAAKGTYCVITLYRAMPSIGDAKNNFDTAWSSLVKETVTVLAEPEMQSPVTEDGWELQSGYSTFENDGNKGIVLLVTASGFKKMVNLVVLTNTDTYQKEMSTFLESMSFKKPAPAREQEPAIKTENNTIAGIWGISSSDQSSYMVNNGLSGYIKRQYNFNANGTYSFFVKTFSYLSDKLFFTKETGTYQLNGNNITITPQTSIFETWTKDSLIATDGRKSGTDKWGKLVSRQKIILEKKTYKYTKHYFTGTEKWALVLQTDNATKRDGPLNNTTEYGSAYLYDAITSDVFLIDLPKGR